MKLNDFKLERYFAQYEFLPNMRLLSSSDCDGLKQSEVLGWADDEMKAKWNDLVLGYTESLGHPMLRKEVAKLYRHVSPDEVLIVVPEEGIFIVMNVLLNPGDHVITTFPGYQSLYEVANSLGCHVDQWMPNEKEGWRFAPQDLERMIKPNTRALVFNFPHNPTGYLPSQEEYKEILKLASKHGLYIFSDEMYRFLEFDEKDRLPSAVEVYDKAIALFGMSKTFGMAGVRLGWLVTKDKAVYGAMAKFKDYTTICSSAPSELLTIIALRGKEKIIKRHLTRISRNLAHLDRFFEEHSSLMSWVHPKAGTIGFPVLRQEEGATAFCERLIREAGIMLLPSSVYDYDDRHFRLGFGRENLPETLEHLKQFLKKHDVFV